LVPVELAGRGKRIFDPLYNTLEEAVDDSFQMISEDLEKMPYAFFGHSMGGIISYELACKTRKENLPEPVHIFFSGRGAPHIPYDEDEELFYDLPDDQFKAKIMELGGTPREFFEHPELLEVIMPLMRSDFKIAETYTHTSKIIPFNFDISVFIGKDEDVNPEQMHGWKDINNKLLSVYYFNGTHFFINDETERIIKIINNTLFHHN